MDAPDEQTEHREAVELRPLQRHRGSCYVLREGAAGTEINNERDDLLPDIEGTSKHASEQRCEARTSWCGDGPVADGFGEEVVVSGQRYRRHDRGTREYHTLCGKVAVARESYRAVGVHNGPTVVPLELRAGLIEQATPALAFSVTQGFAERPLRHYQAELAAAHRHTPSRSTLERIGKRIGDAIEMSVVDVEPEIRLAEPIVEGVWSISFGLDRTTVPMAELLELASSRAPRIRRPPPPVEVVYRMAYVGMVSIHDAGGRVLTTKRFAATPQDEPAIMLERIGGPRCQRS